MRAAPTGGSIFFAVLPRRSVESTAIARRADVPAATRILVVEHAEHDREILVGILKSAGYAVDAVATPLEAMMFWQKSHYDAITLSALTHGNDDIRAFLALVRSEARHQRVPVIALASLA